jgi:hypothetical protein
MRGLPLIVLTLTLALAGCGKKSTPDNAPATGSGSSAATTGSGSGSGSADMVGSAAGSGAAMTGSAGSAAGSGDTAGSGSAAMTGSAGSGAETPMAHHAGNCPSTVFGSTTKAELKGKAVIVTVTSDDKDAVAAIQKRTSELLKEKAAAHPTSGMTHDQKGGHGGGVGLCPVYVPEGAKATSKNEKKGVIVTITHADKADDLKKDIDGRIERAAQWVKDNIKPAPAGDQGGVGGGKGDHGSNHSGEGDGKGKERGSGSGGGKGTGGGTGGGGGKGTGGGGKGTGGGSGSGKK